MEARHVHACPCMSLECPSAFRPKGVRGLQPGHLRAPGGGRRTAQLRDRRRGGPAFGAAPGAQAAAEGTRPRAAGAAGAGASHVAPPACPGAAAGTALPSSGDPKGLQLPPRGAKVRSVRSLLELLWLKMLEAWPFRERLGPGRCFPPPPQRLSADSLLCFCHTQSYRCTYKYL